MLIYNSESRSSSCPVECCWGGRLRTDAEEQRRKESGEKGRSFMGQSWERTEDETKMSRALEKVAKDIGAKTISAGMFFFFISNKHQSG